MKKPMQEKKVIHTDSLARIAIFLEGFKLGRGGNIQPMGNLDLDMLWDTIKYLRGNYDYYCPEYDKYHQLSQEEE